MSTGAADLAGYAAACCTTFAFVPQLVRVLRRRSASDISLPMFLIFSAGLVLWLVYGIARGSWPVILANFATLALSIAILVLKLRFDRHALEELE